MLARSVFSSSVCQLPSAATKFNFVATPKRLRVGRVRYSTAPSQLSGSFVADRARSQSYLDALQQLKKTILSASDEQLAEKAADYPQYPNIREHLLSTVAELEQIVKSEPRLRPRLNIDADSLEPEFQFLKVFARPTRPSNKIEATVPADYDFATHVYIESPDVKQIADYLIDMEAAARAHPLNVVLNAANREGELIISKLLAEADGDTATASSAETKLREQAANRKQLVQAALALTPEENPDMLPEHRDLLAKLSVDLEVGFVGPERHKLVFGDEESPARKEEMEKLNKQLAESAAKLWNLPGVDVSKIKVPSATAESDNFYTNLHPVNEMPLPKNK